MASIKRQKLRGVIIVDTSSLLILSAPVNDKFLKKKAGEKETYQPRYADLLEFLSRHGYEIVFPEMVTYEAGRILRDGRNVGDIFGQVSQEKDDPLFKHARTWLLHTDWANNHNLRIAYPEADNDSNAAIFMKRMWKACQQSPAEAAKNIKALYAESQAGQHYGDEAAHETAAAIPPEIPVFYLCQDNEASAAMIKIKREPPIGRLNVTGLLHAFGREKLFEPAGFANVLSVQDMVETIRADIKKMEPKENKNANMITDYRVDSIYPKPVKDTAGNVIEGKINNYAFARNLEKLAKSLRAQTP